MMLIYVKFYILSLRKGLVTIIIEATAAVVVAEEVEVVMGVIGGGITHPTPTLYLLAVLALVLKVI